MNYDYKNFQHFLPFLVELSQLDFWTLCRYLARSLNFLSCLDIYVEIASNELLFEIACESGYYFLVS